MAVEIQQLIKQKGLKVTQPRVAVLLLLRQQQGDLTVKQIYQHLYQQGRRLSLATVYRVMSDLEEVGLVSSNLLNRDEISYAVPNTRESQMLQIRYMETAGLNQDQFIHSLQKLFSQHNADLLDVEFRGVPPMTSGVCNETASISDQRTASCRCTG